MVTPRGPEERRSLGRGYKPQTYIGGIIVVALVIFAIWFLVLPLFFAT